MPLSLLLFLSTFTCVFCPGWMLYMRSSMKHKGQAVWLLLAITLQRRSALSHCLYVRVSSGGGGSCCPMGSHAIVVVVVCVCTCVVWCIGVSSSIYLFVCLSVCLSVCLPICMYLCSYLYPSFPLPPSFVLSLVMYPQ